jgi:hypothetical protein
MTKINEKQIKNQLQGFEKTSNQLTKKELLLIYGGDPNGIPASVGEGENE